MQITTIGLDIDKNVFQVHGIDASEKGRGPKARSQVIVAAARTRSELLGHTGAPARAKVYVRQRSTPFPVALIAS